MTISSNQPWAIAAGKLYAQAEEEIRSDDKLTRLAGKSRKGLAKAWLDDCLKTVKHLNACLELETSV
jgi:hypothetical protein